MIDKKLKRYIGKDFTLNGDILVICQGDRYSAITLKALIDKTADFKTQHNLGPDVNPWIELSPHAIEQHCLGIAGHTAIWERLRPECLLHRLNFARSRCIDGDYGMPTIHQLQLNADAVNVALEELRKIQEEGNKPRWL